MIKAIQTHPFFFYIPEDINVMTSNIALGMITIGIMTRLVEEFT
jgi:hypothetical protein